MTNVKHPDVNIKETVVKEGNPAMSQQLESKYENGVVNVTSTLLSHDIVNDVTGKQFLDSKMLNFYQSLPC